MLKLKSSLLIVVIALLYVPHLPKVTVDRTGTLAIVAESALLYNGGFSFWSRGWTGFMHQSYMPAQLHCTRVKGLLTISSASYLQHEFTEGEVISS